MNVQTNLAADPAIVDAAKKAVITVFSFRDDMADTLALSDWLYWVRDESRKAKAAGRKIDAETWIELALAADDLCEDDGLPRLFMENAPY